MKHRLFLLDLDDTLLDFKASEREAFGRVMRSLGMDQPLDALFKDYQAINLALWRSFEQGTVSKDFLKVERFRAAFERHALDLDAATASEHYLDSLADTVVLIDGAQALCAELAKVGELGVITNGVERIQSRRIEASGLSPYIAFVATSERCGHAKPDSRFFEYAVARASAFDKQTTVILGDRLDADILGGNQFGIETCWFNPHGHARDPHTVPTYEVTRLVDVAAALRQSCG
ncbi:2-haloacid dehalogenase [Roseateles sp. YR242]|uniref:YjjG family noncanonical pyrimidine nucleotidase n=1 Tax=Roseateles sp. YR242 TaxID=1855305 RepID=UPI0008D78122|nr:YjjG family noncanonical pyrimidine nucleotidase [Roseateles sp. YR242]SEL82775.1 2-haloacid dehalogenase [Roseateles sp. YR242]